MNTQLIEEVMRHEISHFATEMQLLENIINEKGWKIGQPDDYSPRQRAVMSMIIDCLKVVDEEGEDITKEILSKSSDGDKYIFDDIEQEASDEL